MHFSLYQEAFHSLQFYVLDITVALSPLYYKVTNSTWQFKTKVVSAFYENNSDYWKSTHVITYLIPVEMEQLAQLKTMSIINWDIPLTVTRNDNNLANIWVSAWFSCNVCRCRQRKFSMLLAYWQQCCTTRNSHTSVGSNLRTHSLLG